MALISAAASRLHSSGADADYHEGLVVQQRPVSFDPLISGHDPAVHDIAALLYRGVARLDQSGYPQPDLAASIVPSGDGLTYRAAMQPHLSWSSGRPLTADDVVATVTFIQKQGAVDRPLATAWQGITVRNDSGTAVFTLPSPRGGFLEQLAQLPVLPLAGVSGSDLADIAAQPSQPLAASGPYTVTSHSGDTIVLDANPHATSTPHLHRIAIRLYTSFTDAAAAFRSGDVDGVLAMDAQQRDTLLAAGRASSHALMTFRFADLVFNQRSAALADPAVRQAIRGAVDRGALIRGPMGGLAVPQVDAIPQGIGWIAASTPPPASPAATAAAALDAAGWTAGPDGVRSHNGTDLRLRIGVSDGVPLPAVARAVAAQLTAIGVDASVQVIPAAGFNAAITDPTRFDIVLADWDNGPDPDVSTYWRSSATPPAGLNITGAPTDPFLDQSLDRLATLTDPAGRKAAAGQAETEIAGDGLAVFLYAPEVAYVTRDTFAVEVPGAGDRSARFADVTAWDHR